MNNPITALTNKERCLWLASLLIVIASNLLTGSVDLLTVAAALTMLRTSYYALGYAANDIVLIVLWVRASLEEPAYIPIIVNFTIFFVNDLYGFISWRRRELAMA